MGTLRIGKRTENNNPLIKDFVSLADLNDVVFGCWDIFNDTAYESALNAGVLERKDIEPVADEMKALKPMAAVFDKTFVKNLDGPNVKKGATKMDLAEGVMKDIENFKKKNKCKRLVMAWAASTEAYRPANKKTHKSLANFEKA
jgi:myo-inositol-1-phosphate synthase